MSPRKRLERATRLMRMQEQMRRAAEWDLSATRRQAAIVEADRAAILGALSQSAHGSFFLEAAVRRVRTLAGEATSLEAAAAAQAEALCARGLAQKRAEIGVARLSALNRSEAERRDALEQLDRLVAHGDASLP